MMSLRSEFNGRDRHFALLIDDQDSGATARCLPPSS